MWGRCSVYEPREVEGELATVCFERAPQRRVPGEQRSYLPSLQLGSQYQSGYWQPPLIVLQSTPEHVLAV